MKQNAEASQLVEQRREVNMNNHRCSCGALSPRRLPHRSHADGAAWLQGWAFIALSLFILPSFAATVITSSVDGGGQRTASANYTIDASVGGIGGVTSAGTDTNKIGYVGQLTEVIGLAVTGTPTSVSECSNSQLSAIAILDEATLTLLTGGEVTWNIPAFPVASIASNGLATTAAVYQNTLGTFSGSYLGVLGSGALTVLDTLPDNYGSYANDGLPDWWQNQYFGLNNSNAAPSKDVTGTGQNNLFKYVAGLNPTNASSKFVLSIANVSGQPGQKRLIFSPRWNDRTYTPQFRTNLVAGATWVSLTNTNSTDNGTERTVIDLNASEARKFYRISIAYP